MSITAGSVRAIAVAVLVGAGWVCWTAGRVQGRLAEASGQIAMLQYESSLSEYDGIEESLGALGRFPASMTDVLADLGARRAAAAYWDKRYGALSLARDASGELVETNPDILFLAANAAYRTGWRPDGEGPAAVRLLDGVISNYAEVLRKVPGHIDAAYNYEFAVRARLAAVRGPQPQRQDGAAAEGPDTPPTGPPTAGDGFEPGRYDLPAGPTIHGQPGAPPEDSDGSKFKTLVPMRPDERQADPDRSGEGGRPARRG
jgi:hypothetical protein